MRILGTNEFLYTTNLYDEEGRLIQVKSTSVTGGVDIITSQYSWAGQPVVVVHQMKNSAGAVEQTTVTRNTYTAQGQIDKVEKRVQHPSVNNGSMGAWITISQFAYDQLGKQKIKGLGYNASTNSFLETLTNEYNIRDWLLGVNRSYFNSSNSNWFSFELAYDNVSSIAQGAGYSSIQYNGNINGTTWKSRGDRKVRRYNFQYDAANRLKKANFGQYNGSSFQTDQGINFTVDSLTYDENGNIKTMLQFGWKPGGSDVIDALQYTYHKTGLSNRLQNVIDYANDSHSKLGDFKYAESYASQLGGAKQTQAVDYQYDQNGNLTQDLNKSILPNGIVYNVLNLPQTITFDGQTAGSRSIVYQYDATGNKLRKAVFEQGQNPKVTSYRMGSVYENDVLQFTAHEEGRFRVVPATQTLPAYIAFDYFLKDHLGNVRMVLTSEQKVEQFPLADMEDIVDKNNTNDPRNYIPHYVNTDYTVDSLCRVRTSTILGFKGSSDQNKYAARTNGNDRKIGPAIVLKVMSGDKVNIRVNSFWHIDSVPSDVSQNSMLMELVQGLFGLGNLSGAKATVGQLQAANPFQVPVTSFLNNRPSDALKPKAYFSGMLFDEQFQLVTDFSGSDPVGEASVPKSHVFNGLEIPTSGWLVLFVSNETRNVNVYWDDFQVTLIHGPLLEESHYYPFGLTMAGISSKALNGAVGNKRGYNGNELQSKEFFDQSGLDFYDFNARSYDQQVGRFLQIDPLIEEGGQEVLSPYQFSYNNPIRYNDPSGKCPCILPALPYIAEGIVYLAGLAATAYLANETGKAVNKAVRSPAPIGGEGIITGSPLGVPTATTYRALHAESKKEESDGRSKTNQGGSNASTQNEASGRSKNNLKQDDDATGDHSTYLRDKDGNVFKYQEWRLNDNERNPNKFVPGKRFDGGKPDGSPGKPHFDKKTGKTIPTPQVNEPDGNTRKPEKGEYPQNSRFKQN